MNRMDDLIRRQDAIDAILSQPPEPHYPSWYAEQIEKLSPAQPEIMKEYNLKKIYNIYVKIAQAHFVYQPSNPKTITAMPFDWLETQNLLEKYLEEHGADFDALCREYVSDNVKDDCLSPAYVWNKFSPDDERLKDHYFYLISHKNYDTPIKAKWHEEGYWTEPFTMETLYWRHDEDTRDNVSAWTYLPEKYKEV